MGTGLSVRGRGTHSVGVHRYIGSSSSCMSGRLHLSFASSHAAGHHWRRSEFVLEAAVHLEESVSRRSKSSALPERIQTDCVHLHVVQVHSCFWRRPGRTETSSEETHCTNMATAHSGTSRIEEFGKAKAKAKACVGGGNKVHEIELEVPSPTMGRRAWY